MDLISNVPPPKEGGGDGGQAAAAPQNEVQAASLALEALTLRNAIEEEQNEIIDFSNDDEPLVASVEHFEGGAAKVAGMAIIQKSEINREGPWVVFVSEKGRGKRVKVSDFKTQIRGGAGIRGIKFNSGDSLAAFALIGKTDDDSIEEAIIVGSQLGVANRFQCASIPEMGRYAKGGMLMKLKKEDAIKSFAVIPATTED